MGLVLRLVIACLMVACACGSAAEGSGDAAPIDGSPADGPRADARPLPPGLSVSSSSLEFGNHDVHAIDGAEALTVTLTNTGSESQAFAAVLSDDTVFSMNANDCTGVVAPDASCDIVVTFSPQAVGPSSANIDINGVPAVGLYGAGSAIVEVTVRTKGSVTGQGFSCVNPKASPSVVCEVEITSPSYSVTAAEGSGYSWDEWGPPCSSEPPTAPCTMQCFESIKKLCTIDLNDTVFLGLDPGAKFLLDVSFDAN